MSVQCPVVHFRNSLSSPRGAFESLDNNTCRRSGPRARISLPVLLRTHENDIGLPVRVCNMSAKGIALRTPDELSEGSQVEVTLLVPYEISLTRSIPVRIPAEVVRVQQVENAEDCDVGCVLQVKVGHA